VRAAAAALLLPELSSAVQRYQFAEVCRYQCYVHQSRCSAKLACRCVNMMGECLRKCAQQFDNTGEGRQKGVAQHNRSQLDYLNCSCCFCC
jgi:hypothetical protein